MRKRILPLLILALLLTGCGSQGARQSLIPEENRLVVYTSHKEEVYQPIIREFEERTGIWVELVTGGSNELLDRLEQEQEAPRADVMFGGGVESLESCRELFEPVRCTDYRQIPASLRDAQDAWVPFSALPVVLIYNTKLVDPAKLTGWEDLTGPKFRGEIAFADPTKSASSFTAVATVLQACGEETALALARNLAGEQLDSSGQVLTQVAGGEKLVGITLEETALQRIAAGDNLALVYPREGTSCVPDGTAVLKNAPHRDNALEFLDFTLSRAVQEMLGSRFYRRSVREDVGDSDTLPGLDRLKLTDYDTLWASRNRGDILQKWAEAVKEGAV